jgi:hypothetical protein
MTYAMFEARLFANAGTTQGHRRRIETRLGIPRRMITIRLPWRSIPIAGGVFLLQKWP